MKTNNYELSNSDLQQAENFLKQIKKAEKLEKYQLFIAKKLAITIYQPKNHIHYLCK